MTDGEFVFVGFKSYTHEVWYYPPSRWGRPDFHEEPSKCNPDPFATHDIKFCKEVELPAKHDDGCQQKS